MDVIKRVPKLQRIGSAALDKFLNLQIACRNYAYQHGIDRPDVVDWRWQHKTRKTVAAGSKR